MLSLWGFVVLINNVSRLKKKKRGKNLSSKKTQKETVMCGKVMDHN